MQVDTRRAILTHGRLQHKGSFGFLQNAEIIVQVAWFFSHLDIQCGKQSHRIFNIYRHTLFMVHYR